MSCRPCECLWPKWTSLMKTVRTPPTPHPWFVGMASLQIGIEWSSPFPTFVPGPRTFRAGDSPSYRPNCREWLFGIGEERLNNRGGARSQPEPRPDCQEPGTSPRSCAGETGRRRVAELEGEGVEPVRCDESRPNVCV